jgi:hypothetical protein
MGFKRALGANAVTALAFETAYGTSPVAGYFKTPIAGQLGLGDVQDLIESDLIGFGREPLDPADDVVNNEGDVRVPVDLRYFGLWLKLMFGTPVTTQGKPATGSIAFSANPANTGTVTINGTLFTFKTSPVTATEVQIGADLADTVSNLVIALNASADPNVTPATYSANLDLNTLTVTHDTIGTAGNTFTLAASSSPASNGTVSSATLSGGAATGPFNHVFASGAVTLPSASVEIGMTDVNQYFMNFGAMANTLSIAMQRSGLLNATIGLVAQGERPPTGATGAGAPSELDIKRFVQAVGVIKDRGVPLGRIQSATLRYSNVLEKDESIRPDGRIGGADAGQISTGIDNLVVRFGDPRLYNIAVNKTSVEISVTWEISATEKLTITYHRMRLPKSKLPIDGPKGIMATFNAKASRETTLLKSVTATLVNDVASY